VYKGIQHPHTDPQGILGWGAVTSWPPCRFKIPYPRC